MNKFTLLLSSVLLSSAVTSAFAAEPDGYYSSCEGFGGQTLITKLASVVGPHTNVGYDGLWEVYNESDVDANGLLWDMYSTKRWTPGKERCGNYSLVGDCVNREHSFPKSWFDDKSPMVSDAFHIYPTDGKVNGQRSNYPYGECSGGTTLPSNNGVKALGRLGTCTFSGYSGKVFEPDNEYKGDLARSYFYMAAAYNSSISSWSSDMLAGNSYPAFSSWALNLLLKWHREDPVSQKEIDRNDAVYKYQKNRNPFIDHPELVEYVWGNKTSEKWYAAGAPDPAFTLPADNSTVDFGTAPVNYQVSRSISLRTANLTQPVAISVSSADFTPKVTSIAASQANAGTSFVVVLNASTAGNKSAVMTLSSGDLSVKVNLSAYIVDGIPALAASDVDVDAFTANWMSLGDEETYTLNVMLNGASIAGYPKSVAAESEEYRVENLSESTTYTYQLSSSTMTSNIVSVTTATPVPEIQYIGSDEIALEAMPGVASDATEVWLYSENIDSNITVSVDAPFQVSSDMTNWATTLTMAPDEERFYIRVNASPVGNYASFIRLTAGDYVNDGGQVTATVRDTSTPWFIEDFENAVNATNNLSDYNAGSYEGASISWVLTNAGIWSSDSDKNGNYSLRFGKTSSSTIQTAQPKEYGIGTVSFYASRWSASDGDMTINVEYSPDGENWIYAGEVVVSNDDLTQYNVTVNTSGNNYLRLRQSAGARGNIDDIVATDYSTVSITPVDVYEQWTAFSLNGSLTIVNNTTAARRFIAYDMEGKTLADLLVAPGATVSTPLPAGLYIVTDLTDARRVLIK